MNIVAKFRCTGVEKKESWRGASEKFLYAAKFIPVGDNSEENERFWEATPAGSIEMSSILQDAFEVGQEYYVTFSVDSPVPAP